MSNYCLAPSSAPGYAPAMPGKRKANSGILYVSSVPKGMLRELDAHAKRMGPRARRGDAVYELLRVALDEVRAKAAPAEASQ